MKLPRLLLSAMVEYEPQMDFSQLTSLCEGDDLTTNKRCNKKNALF